MDVSPTSARGVYNWLLVTTLAFALGVALVVFVVWMGWTLPLG